MRNVPEWLAAASGAGTLILGTLTYRHVRGRVEWEVLPLQKSDGYILHNKGSRRATGITVTYAPEAPPKASAVPSTLGVGAVCKVDLVHALGSMTNTVTVEWDEGFRRRDKWTAALPGL